MSVDKESVMKMFIDVLKENANAMKWLLLASVVATLFVLAIATGTGMAMMRVTTAVLLVVIGRRVEMLSVIGLSPLSRMCAPAPAYLLYWCATFFATKAIVTVLDQPGFMPEAASILPVVISLGFAVWLWGKLFGKKWLSRLSMQVQTLVTTVKFGALDEPRDFQELDSHPVVLSNLEFKRAKRIVIHVSAGGVFVAYVVTVLLHSVIAQVHSFDSLIVALALTSAGAMIYVWEIFAFYRLWKIARDDRRGLRTISPWEMFVA